MKLVEYKTLERNNLISEAELNMLGSDGWDLVHILENTKTRVITPGVKSTTHGFIYIFKRPRE